MCEKRGKEKYRSSDIIINENINKKDGMLTMNSKDVSFQIRFLLWFDLRYRYRGWNLDLSNEADVGSHGGQCISRAQLRPFHFL